MNLYKYPSIFIGSHLVLNNIEYYADNIIGCRQSVIIYSQDVRLSFEDKKIKIYYSTKYTAQIMHFVTHVTEKRFISEIITFREPFEKLIYELV